MVPPTTGSIWQAEARTQETRQFIKDIKRITRRKFTAEEKIRIVLEGFRHEGIQPSTYYVMPGLKTSWRRVRRGSPVTRCAMLPALRYRSSSAKMPG